MRTVAVALTAGLMLSACGGPARNAAAEAKVDMTPGLYTISGGAAGIPSAASENAPGGGPKEVCLTAERLTEWPLAFVRQYAMLHEGCESQGLKRTGNAFSGTFLCPVDPQRATGSTTVAYEGEVSPTETTLRTNVQMNVEPVNATEEQKRDLQLGKAMMSNLTLEYRATRKGDCS